MLQESMVYCRTLERNLRCLPIVSERIQQLKQGKTLWTIGGLCGKIITEQEAQQILAKEEQKKPQSVTEAIEAVGAQLTAKKSSPPKPTKLELNNLLRYEEQMKSSLEETRQLCEQSKAQRNRKVTIRVQPPQFRPHKPRKFHPKLVMLAGVFAFGLLFGLLLQK